MKIEWRKSSYTHDQGECVELSTNTADKTLIRDSKHPDGPRLTFGRTELAGLVSRVKAGDLDL